MSKNVSSGTIKTNAATADVYKTNRYNAEKQNPSNETKALQTSLNSFGYVGKDKKPLKVDGILGPKTRVALEKHIQDGIPKQEVLDMQKLFNEMGITDKDGNVLKQDGKLGVKTDSAVHNAIKLFGGITDKDLQPVRGDAGNLMNETLVKRTIDNEFVGGKYNNPIKKEVSIVSDDSKNNEEK